MVLNNFGASFIASRATNVEIQNLKLEVVSNQEIYDNGCFRRQYLFSSQNRLSSSKPKLVILHSSLQLRRDSKPPLRFINGFHMIKIGITTIDISFSLHLLATTDNIILTIKASTSVVNIITTGDDIGRNRRK